MTPQSTAAELEQQAGTDGGIEDESWRDQSIPTFDEAPKTRDEKIDELDARDDRLNGHATEVRPSQRCKIKSPTGIGCALQKSHDDRHSWEASSVATLTEEQPALPGTPEPEVTEYTIPTESAFSGKDFVSAPGLKEIGQRLIEQHASLSVLNGVEVRYLWKRRGGTTGGNPKIGYLQRPGGLLRYYTGGVTFIAVLAADHARDLLKTPQQIEAAIFHVLLHADTDPNDDSNFRLRGHTFEGFVEELDVYGPWSADLRELAAHAANLTPLEQAIADAEEGEESD